MNQDQPPQSSMILYTTEDGRARIECRFESETIWLTQKLIADLFQIGVNTVNYHLKEIYNEKELDAGSTIRSYRIVQTEGERQIARDVEHYSLPAILAVGYRVRSHRGTQFRQMGIRKEDVAIAKNYLDEEELHALNRIVNAYLEFAELQALNRKPMTMNDWISKLDDFLKLSGRELLNHAGKISAEDAKEKAEAEYARYRRLIDSQPRPVDAHFEQAVKKLPKARKPRKPKGDSEP